MRHVKYLRNGTRNVLDGQIPCTVVIMGQRSEAHAASLLPEAPPPPASAEAMTKEHHAYRKAIADHRRRQTSGYFAETTLEWCEDETEAKAILARFPEPEWINVRIEPIDTVLN